MSLTSTSEPLVSVLVNCYNSEAFLKQALDSVFTQTYQNFEIILVDNCSQDRTADIAKSYGPKLKYVKTLKNCPLYAARNAGLPHVTGDFLCVLDSDDYWVSDKLQSQVELMKKESGIDILYAAYYSHFEATHSKVNQLKRLYLKLINFSDNSMSEGYVNSFSIIKNYNINFQTIMFRVSSIRNIQFDDRLNLMGDLDFIYRLVWIKQAKIFFQSKITAYSRIHARQLSRKSDLRWVIESLKVLSKIQSCMSTAEIKVFNKYFIQFYYSSYLLRVKNYSKSLLLKSHFMFSSLRFFMHFLKSVFTAIRGS
jgi:glycosyltransferase involved in cell wall biosynthesis